MFDNKSEIEELEERADKQLAEVETLIETLKQGQQNAKELQKDTNEKIRQLEEVLQRAEKTEKMIENIIGSVSE